MVALIDEHTFRLKRFKYTCVHACSNKKCMLQAAAVLSCAQAQRLQREKEKQAALKKMPPAAPPKAKCAPPPPPFSPPFNPAQIAHLTRVALHIHERRWLSFLHRIHN
eukprot:6175472-Pleurochrysis_carterae.AAC.3